MIMKYMHAYHQPKVSIQKERQVTFGRTVVVVVVVVGGGGGGGGGALLNTLKSHQVMKAKGYIVSCIEIVRCITTNDFLKT